MTDGTRPQIIYALVIRGPKVVLSEYTALAGNFQQATIQILQKLEQTAEYKSYIYGEYAFHYTIDKLDEGNSLWFVCMAEKALGRRIPFAFLAAVQDKFKQMYTNDDVRAAIAYAMQNDFKGEIQGLMEKYNGPGGDKIAAMQEKVRNINDNLMDSIDKILERQEKIELLVNRSQMLSQSSTSFRRETQTLRNQIWWKNARMMLILGGLAILIILILIFFTVCHGFSFQC